MGVTPPAVDLRIAAGDWSALATPEALAERAAGAACAELGLDAGGYEVAILLTDDAEIARLNADFRDKPTPTNVLSWPAFPLSPGADGVPPSPPRAQAGEETPLGDIALAAETVAREAEERGLAMADHATHLITHAFLHLLGYDHRTEAEAEAMERVERRALARIGVADPYV
jgi:probable rRNA maturation factor